MAFATSQSIDQLLARGLSFRLPNNAPISSLYTLYANGAGQTYWSNSINPRDLSTLSSAIGEVGSTVAFQQTEIDDLNIQVAGLSTALSTTSNALINYVNSSIAGLSTFSTFYNDLGALSNVVRVGFSTLSTAIAVGDSNTTAFLTSTLTSTFTSRLLSSSTGLYNYTNRVSSATVFTTTFVSTTAALNRAILSTSTGLNNKIDATNVALSTNISTLRISVASTNTNFFSTISGYGPRIGTLETASTGISSFTNFVVSTQISASQSTQDAFLNARFATLSSYVSTIAIFATAQFGSLSSLSTALYASISTNDSVNTAQNVAISSLSRNLSILTTSSILAGIYDTFVQLEGYTTALINSTVNSMNYFQSTLYYSTIIQNQAISQAYFSTFTGTAFLSTVSATTALSEAYVSSYTSALVSTNAIFINNTNSTTIGVLYSTGYEYLISSYNTVPIPSRSTVVYIGSNAASTSQGQFGVAVGFNAGRQNQGSNAVAVGVGAGQTNQGKNTVAIGNSAGSVNMGSNSIAIGARAGTTSQHSGTIVINAQSSSNELVLNTDGPDRLFIAPIRNDEAIGGGFLHYNSTTREIVYNAQGGSGGGSSEVMSTFMMPVYLSTVNTLGDLYVNTNANGTPFRIGINTSTPNALVDISGSLAFSTINSQRFVVNPSNSNAGIAIGTDAGVITQNDRAIAIGTESGQDNQGTSAVAIGLWAGQSNMGTEAVAIGSSSGRDNQAAYSVAIGSGAGNANQGSESVAVGNSAGGNTQGASNVAIGTYAGQSLMGDYAVAIGTFAGKVSQTSNAVAIGNMAGSNTQGDGAIAIGISAGCNVQLANSIAIGANAGEDAQQAGSVAIGYFAGKTSQGPSTVAIGNTAGFNTQGSSAVAIGTAAGFNTQGQDTVAIGVNAGQNLQLSGSVAIGSSAGNASQGADSVAIGIAAGLNTQAGESVAIGGSAGRVNQLENSVAIGFEAGCNVQSRFAVAVGSFAGRVSQQSNAIAIGYDAGRDSQASNAVAIGWQAGFTSQGSNAIAIGYQAGLTSQLANSIVLNASGSALNTAAAGFYVNPVRSNAAIATAFVHYDTVTKELVYNAVGGNTITSSFNNIYFSTSFGVSSVANNGRFNVINVSTIGGFSPITFTDDVVFPGNATITSQTNNLITWQAVESSQNWSGIASSSDGTKLVAVVSGGQIYTSIDSGTTWTARETARTWLSVASSSDGTKLVAVVFGGQIYTSINSGTSWTARENNRNWISVASSSDGTKLVAVVNVGFVYTSTDSGASWTQRFASASWRSVACSADGTQIIAVVQGDKIYTSSDSGVNWLARDNPNSRSYFGAASSSDGTKLVAVVNGGQIFTSANSGLSWTARENIRNWVAVTSSSDGTKLVAVEDGGRIYRSTDSGVTWSASESNRGWRAIASSSDGIKLAAVDGLAGRIYITTILSSNSFLGINTLTPTYNLDVLGDARILGSTITSNMYITGTLTSIGQNQAVRFNASTVLTSSIGVGTTTPAFPLDVAGTANMSSLIVNNRGFTNNTLGNTNIQSRNGTSAFIFTSATDALISYIQGNSNIYFTTTGSAVGLVTIGTSGTYAGRVGIGTTTPAYALDVNGAARVSSVLYNQQLYTDTYLSERFHIINGYNNANTQWGSYEWFVSKTTIGQQTASTMTLFSYVNSRPGVASNVLSISPSANVGIKTTAPAYDLDVAGTINTSNLRFPGAGGAQATFTSHGNSASPSTCSLTWGGINGWFFYFRGATCNATNVMSLNNSGLVGINCNFPAYTLDIAGTARATGSVFLATTAGCNVGIGTTTPAYALDIAGTANMSSLIVNNRGFTDNILGNTIIKAPNNSSAFRFTSDTDASISYFQGTSNIYFTTIASSTSVVAIGTAGTYAGRVGIGTTTPAYALDVASTIRTSNLRIPSGGGTATDAIFNSQGGSPSTASVTWGNGSWYFYFRGNPLNATNVMALRDNGSVGINCNVPAYTLDVGGTAHKQDNLTTWNTTSDRRIKTEIEFADLSICLSSINSLQLKRYQYDSNIFRDRYDNTVLGLIAQDVQTVFPKAVFSTVAYGFTDLLNLDFDQIYKANIGATQRLAQIVDAAEDFTGTHRCFPADSDLSSTSNIGKVVIATGGHQAVLNGVPLRGLSSITASQSPPLVSLARNAKDRRCFGVIGSNAGGGRLAINSVGEGCIWVCEANGPVQNGDYLTTSDADGYAMKQGEEYVANFTVAKATMDCDFSALPMPALTARTSTVDGQRVYLRDENGNYMWEAGSNLEPPYALRYITQNGNTISKAEYDALVAGGDVAYRAAFIGCTYHSG